MRRYKVGIENGVYYCRLDPIGGWVDAAEMDVLLDKINMMACYATEEDTDSREQALLEIGKLARSARASVTESDCEPT